jgi:hypothetical protein
MSPNELRYSCQPRGIADLLYHPFEGISESAEKLAESLKNKRDNARDAFAMAQRKQKQHYDKRHTPNEFNVGDLFVLKVRSIWTRTQTPYSSRTQACPNWHATQSY